MLVCPKCKSGYREGFKVCSDCKVELIDIEKNYDVKSRNIENNSKFRLVFLKNVSDGFEDDTISSLLKSNNINVFRKQKGSGQMLKLYSGRSFYGADLYVFEHHLKKAQEIIAFMVANIEDEEHKKEENLDEKEHIKKTKFFRWFILIFVIIPGVIVFVAALINILLDLFRIFIK